MYTASPGMDDGSCTDKMGTRSKQRTDGTLSVDGGSLGNEIVFTGKRTTRDEVKVAVDKHR